MFIRQQKCRLIFTLKYFHLIPHKIKMYPLNINLKLWKLHSLILIEEECICDLLIYVKKKST